MAGEAEAVLAMERVLLEEFEKFFPQDERSQKIRRVARAIATANGQGKYLDCIVMGYPTSEPYGKLAMCGKGTVSLQFPLQPCWATYVQDAIAAIDACETSDS